MKSRNHRGCPVIARTFPFFRLHDRMRVLECVKPASSNGNFRVAAHSWGPEESRCARASAFRRGYLIRDKYKMQISIAFICRGEAGAGEFAMKVYVQACGRAREGRPAAKVLALAGPEYFGIFLILCRPNTPNWILFLVDRIAVLTLGSSRNGSELFTFSLKKLSRYRLDIF